MTDPTSKTSPTEKAPWGAARRIVLTRRDEIRDLLEKGATRREVYDRLDLASSITFEGFRQRLRHIERGEQPPHPTMSEPMPSPAEPPSREVSRTEPTPVRRPFVRYDKLDPEKVARWCRPGPGTKARQD